MADNRTLHVVKEFGSLINSGLIVIAACGLVYKWGADTNEVGRRIDANAEAIAKFVIEDGRRWDGHAQLHKDRMGEIREKDGAVAVRLASIEQNAEADGRKIDNAVYRVTVLEQNRVGDSAAIREVQKSVTELAGDMKVVRELLQRQSNDQAKETR